MYRPLRKQALRGAACAILLVSLLANPATSQASGKEEKIVDAAAVQLSQTWGVPIEEASYRISVQGQINDLTVELNERYPEFAGGFIDQGDGGRVHFLATAWSDEMIGQIKSSMPEGIPFSTNAVKYGLDELNKVLDTLPTVVSPDLAVATTVRVKQNSVELAIFESTRDRDQLQAQVERQFGSAVSFVVIPDRQGRPEDYAASCSYPSASVLAVCDPVTRGGVGIVPDGYAKICSSGFNVRSDIDDKPYILTAGHCLKQNGEVGNPWKGRRPVGSTLGTTYTLGTAQNYTWSTNLDSGIINVATSNFGDGRIFQSSSAGIGYPTTRNENYPISTTPGVLGPLVGEYLCKSGTTGGTACGTLESSFYTSPYSGNQRFGFIQFDRDAAGNYVGVMCHGDSGGPIVVAGKGYGIVSEVPSPAVVAVRNNNDCAGGALFRNLTEALNNRNVHLVAP